MNFPIGTLLLSFFFLSAANATVYNNRAAFEAAIDIIYKEDFESLAGSVATHGTSLTLPTGLTVTVNTGNSDEIFSIPAGFVGPKGPLSNTSTALGDRLSSDPTRQGDGLSLFLGDFYQAVGFDFYTNLDLSNPNVGADFQFDLFAGDPAAGNPDDALIGQFVGGLSTRSNPLFPVAGFFGFINDGNLLDTLVGNGGELQNGFLSSVRQTAAFDRLFVSNFDGSGRYEFVDNVTVGQILTTTPVPIPATGWLLFLSTLSLLAWQRRAQTD